MPNALKILFSLLGGGGGRVENGGGEKGSKRRLNVRSLPIFDGQFLFTSWQLL